MHITIPSARVPQRDAKYHFGVYSHVNAKHMILHHTFWCLVFPFYNKYFTFTLNNSSDTFDTAGLTINQLKRACKISF